jgi:hypothetical protein
VDVPEEKFAGKENAMPRATILTGFNLTRALPLSDRDFRDAVSHLVIVYKKPICTTQAAGDFVTKTERRSARRSTISTPYWPKSASAVARWRKPIRWRGRRGFLNSVRDSKRSSVYYLQNRAIHAARAELEAKGIIEKGQSLEMCRFLAGKLNLGIASVSKLSLTQRETLIGRLIEMGATVKNPILYASDRGSEKIAPFTKVSEEQLRMVDALAARVAWKEKDGYLRFCHKLLKAPRRGIQEK